MAQCPFEQKNIYQFSRRPKKRFVMGFDRTLILPGAFGLLAPQASALLHNVSMILLSMDCLTELLPDEKTITDKKGGAAAGDGL